MKYTNVVMARTDEKGNFGPTKVGKAVMKHVMKAVRAKAQVTMTQRIVGDHKSITVYGEWRHTFAPSKFNIDELPGGCERTVTKTWKEVRESRRAAPDMKIVADIEIID